MSECLMKRMVSACVLWVVLGLSGVSFAQNSVDPPDSFDGEAEAKSVYDWQTDDGKPRVTQGLDLDKAILKSALEDLRPTPLMESPRGTNRGREIDQYLKECGLGVGQPWCAAFVSHHVKKGASDVRSRLPEDFQLAWVMTANCNDIYHWGLFHRNMLLSRPLVGSIFLVRRSNGTFKHCGIVVSIGADGRSIETVEGNSNDDGSSEGIGVFNLRRSVAKLQFVRAG
jgi:hypothetical protein